MGASSPCIPGHSALQQLHTMIYYSTVCAGNFVYTGVANRHCKLVSFPCKDREFCNVPSRMQYAEFFLPQSLPVFDCLPIRARCDRASTANNFCATFAGGWEERDLTEHYHR